MAELKELEVERVDAVDRPATRRPFLILKAEEPDELRENVRAVLEKVQHALTLLAKVQDLELDEETAAALNEVAKAVEMEPVFQPSKKPKDEEDQYGYAYGYPPRKKPTKKDEEEGLVDALAAVLDEKLGQLRDGLIEALTPKPAAVAKSRQPAAQDAPDGRKPLGEGLFEDIIFGR